MFNYVDFLSKEDLDSEIKKEYLGILERKTNRISVLLKDLKDSIIANSNTINLDIKEIDIKEVLNQALLEAKERLIEKKMVKSNYFKYL